MGTPTDVPAFFYRLRIFGNDGVQLRPVCLRPGLPGLSGGGPCLAAPNVPAAGSVPDLVHFRPLPAPLADWAATANRIAAHGDHADYWPTLAAAGYELKTAARRMEQLYDRLGARA